MPGGQASHTSLIENFFGFPDGIGGAELARRAGRQAEGFGDELMILTGIADSAFGADGQATLMYGHGRSVTADVVIVAPGMAWRQLNAPGVEELLGRGVYYGAGRSEAARCRRAPVFVVGAGNSAGQAAMHLASAGAHVSMLVRGEHLASSMSAYLVDRIERHPSVEVRFGTRVNEAHEHNGALAAVTIEDAAGSVEQRPAHALFVCIGVSRGPAGPAIKVSSPIRAATSSPGRTSSTSELAPRTGRSSVIRLPWRPAFRASSRPATCGTDLPSASPRPLATEPVPWRSRIAALLNSSARDARVGHQDTDAEAAFRVPPSVRSCRSPWSCRRCRGCVVGPSAGPGSVHPRGAARRSRRFGFFVVALVSLYRRRDPAPREPNDVGRDDGGLTDYLGAGSIDGI